LVDETINVGTGMMEKKDAQTASGVAQLKQVNVVDYIAVLARQKKLIVRLVGISLLTAIVLLYLVIPRWYKSTAVVMPPKQKNTLGLLSSITRATSSFRTLGLGPVSEDLSQLQTIVASRRVRETVVKKFDLIKVYDVDTMEKALRELEGNVSVALGKEDVSLEIAVLDTDPVRAAEMANFFVETLDKVYLELSVSEARRNREFLERRYLGNMKDLKDAEEAFKAFQQKYGVYSVPDQVKAAVEAAATLESRVAMKEVQLGLLSQSTTQDNPMRQSVVLELGQLRRQLAIMKHGSGKGEGSSLVFAPFDKAPEIGLLYLRNLRDIELQGKLLEFLLPLYEQAKIEEQRDTPSVIVLDAGVPAVKPSKPKRMIILALVGAGMFIISYLIALFREFLKRQKLHRSTEEEAQLAMIRKELSWRNLFR
jgi:uncharacterized protein involved in exopolysaccharide biosynthesis